MRAPGRPAPSRYADVSKYAIRGQARRGYAAITSSRASPAGWALSASPARGLQTARDPLDAAHQHFVKELVLRAEMIVDCGNVDLRKFDDFAQRDAVRSAICKELLRSVLAASAYSPTTQPRRRCGATGLLVVHRDCESFVAWESAPSHVSSKHLFGMKNHGKKGTGLYDRPRYSHRQ
jgi:hypothetical protein